MQKKITSAVNNFAVCENVLSECNVSGGKLFPESCPYSPFLDFPFLLTAVMATKKQLPFYSNQQEPSGKLESRAVKKYGTELS
jgi:hypothetical protein